MTRPDTDEDYDREYDVSGSCLPEEAFEDQ